MASKLLLGARHAYRRAETEMRQGVRRARWWLDQQNPEQVMQLTVLVVYGLVAVAEAVAYKRKGARDA